MPILQAINQHFTDYYSHHKKQIFAFGVIMFINYLLYYFIFDYKVSHSNLSLVLRMVASSLCVPLILVNYWPVRYSRLFNVYWHVVVIYCLPFFFTFMTLVNKISAVWLMNSVAAMFFMLLILDILSFIIALLVGSGLGVMLFKSYYDFINLGAITLKDIIATFFAVIVIGIIFSYKKEQVHQQKLDSLRALGGTIAHEMRTPLGAISATIFNLKTKVPELINSYKLAKEGGIKVPEIRERELENIKAAPEHIGKINKSALLTIDMLLAKINDNTQAGQLVTCSMQNIINKVLEEYPLKEQEKVLINLDNIHNFEFLGNEYMIMHVLFNLLKNALFYIHEMGKGSITIRIELGEKDNILYFRDTAKGIPKNILPNIFEKFFTRSKYGTGLGLAFCKMVMESIGGSIKCDSQEGIFTEFSIKFPKI
ncbi:sensor histidine kinase [Rickettsiales endosymbiont of Stachyamoeba lipophora]|nr:sensor histidine kinase [Rickettsiales endosymbiont of Stachyamoeba lipophora]